MALNINRNELDLRLYNNYFGNYSTNIKKPISNNSFKETSLLPQTDKKTLNEVQKAVVTFNETKAVDNVCSASETAKGFGMDGVKRFLKEFLGIDLQGIPSPVDLLDSLANGLQAKCGDAAKQYVENIKNEIEKLRQASTKPCGIKENIVNIFNGLKIGVQLVLNLPSAMLGTLGELGGGLLKKIFGEKLGNAMGQVISACLTPFKFVGEFVFGSLIALIKLPKKLKEMRKNIGNIVKNMLVTNVCQAFLPLINLVRKACGYPPVQESPKPQSQLSKNGFVRFWQMFGNFFTKLGRIPQEKINQKYQKELEKEVSKYMKNNEQTCKKTITEEITKMINGLVNMIIGKANSVASQKLKGLKNRVALYQVSNTKINHPKIIILVPQYKIPDNSSASQQSQKKSENLKRLNELSKLYQQCTLVKDFMTDAQKKELDEIKKTLDNEYKLVNNK